MIIKMNEEWKKVIREICDAGWTVVAFSPEEILETGLDSTELHMNMHNHFERLVDSHKQMKNQGE